LLGSEGILSDRTACDRTEENGRPELKRIIKRERERERETQVDIKGM